MDSITKDEHAFLLSCIRDIPDYPKKGIIFKDITPLLQNPEALKITTEALTRPYRGKEIDLVVGLESRGFLFGPSVAQNLGAGFIPVRKPNKLPFHKIAASYELEYGADTVEMHSDAVKKGQRVLIHDDLIATGGTAAAATELVQKLGGEIVGYSFLINLSFLNGKDKLDKNGLFEAVITL
ncbi:adenine phosphoribosyltransferase [Cyclonatronum proteinivorum]|uniref:Adenine phosphoribosyltransferase n=1 Tax=Cyclonatronum proteinivorum TaxID=1457365 RepID=A0A345UK58_9BACT|nr:adenine phosphoribosyltransferase [Cyclonatronum proteinivorum]AXJ00860.1 adenine phosphoribosyltransferase [Cyclonatronum proteinivorum]